MHQLSRVAVNKFLREWLLAADATKIGMLPHANWVKESFAARTFFTGILTGRRPNGSANADRL